MVDPTHTIVVADGALDVPLLLARYAADPRPRLIAADGGAGRVLGAGLVPDLVLGDLDSLDASDRQRLEGLGVEVRTADRDKDESDTELCLLASLADGATHISLLGATGVVRPEHGIANLLLLADPRLDEIEVEIVGHGSRIVRIGTADGPGRLEIEGRSGDYVSLFPLGATVTGVHTDGLRFRLQDESLRLGPSRGLSNEMTGSRASVRAARGLLLVVHTDPHAEIDRRHP